MRIVLHLEVDEEELSLSEEDFDKMSKDQKELELTIAMNEYINSIDDWCQVWEFKED